MSPSQIAPRKGEKRLAKDARTHERAEARREENIKWDEAEKYQAAIDKAARLKERKAVLQELAEECCLLTPVEEDL